MEPSNKKPPAFSSGEGFGFLENKDLEAAIKVGTAKEEAVTRYGNKQYEYHKVLPDPSKDTYDLVKTIKSDCFSDIREDIRDGYHVKNPMSKSEYLEQKEKWNSNTIKRFTFHAPIELQERVRNLSYWTRISVSDLGCHALALMVRQMEVDFNNSYPYKLRRQELKKGRKSN